jgi:osmotically-inducible protein OsmY
MWKRMGRWSFALASSVMFIAPVWNARAEDQDTAGMAQPGSPPVKDDWITSQIKRTLSTAVAGAKDIDVDTKNDVVTLSGSTPSEAARTQAVQVARGTEGVRQVKDEIKVKPGK